MVLGDSVVYLSMYEGQVKYNQDKSNISSYMVIPAYLI